MESYLEQLSQLADGEEKTALALEIQGLASRFDPSFSIVVVGDVSRGKSTLINRLLHEDILPTGNIPTTKIPAKITYGKQERLTIVTEGNKTEVIPVDGITSETWQEQNTTQFILELANENMHVTNVVFHDTPALDLGKDGENTYIEEISYLTKTADAVVLVLTAHSPLSFSNVDFLRNHVRNHQVPQLLIVLNYLDQAKKGQVQLLSSIHAKLNSLDQPYTFIGITDKPETASRDFLDGTTYSDIWKEILTWTRSPEHPKLRQRQQLRQVELLAFRLKDAIDLKIKENKNKREERERIRNTEYNSIQRKDASWNTVELKLEERLRVQQKFVEQRVTAYTPQLMDLMHYSLSKTADIKHWYETELPFLLKGQLESLRENISRTLQQRIEADFKLIETEVNKLVNNEFHLSKNAEQTIATSATPILPVVEEKLLKNKKQVTMQTVTIAAIVGYFVFGPLGAAISTGGGLLTDLLTKKSASEQKELLLNRLNQTFKKQLHLLTISIGDQLSTLYKTNTKHLHQQAKKTKNEVLEELEARRLQDVAIPKELQLKREQISLLLENINTAQSSIYGNE